MRVVLFKILMIIALLLTQPLIKSQIGDIQDLASGAASAFSGCSGSDVSAACNTFDCCWNGGYLFIDFLINHHQEIMDMRYLDPCLLSLEMDANFAYAIHYSSDSNRYYNYVNYLPHVRGNLGIVSLDFRYNILTEYTNDFPNSFKSWELLLLLNFVPVDNFKMSLGSGVYYEVLTEKYYNENYFGIQIGLSENKDFIDINTRFVIDYTTSKLPFLEAGISYKYRFINFPHASAYLILGGIYQNYYQEHDIWAANAGFAINIH